MDILVTGSSGFLGRPLCKALREKGHTIIQANTKTCDLTEQGSLEILNSFTFDKIFHLAAWTQAGDFPLKHPGEQWIINQQINTNMLEWWHRKQPQAKLIAMGTSCSYDPTLPLEEEYYLQGLPIESLFSYAMTKRMLLAGLIALHRQYKHQFLYLVPSTLYGPSYHTDGKQMHFIFDLIRKILNGRHKDEQVILWGDGEQKRELIHVEDFVKTALDLDAVCANTWVNVGSGEEYSIKAFASLICKVANYPSDKIQYDLGKYVGARSKVLSIEKLVSLLPSFKLRPLEEGLQETIEWFEQECFQNVSVHA